MKKKLKNLFNEVDWKKAYMDVLDLYYSEREKDMRVIKRQRLIAYIIGVVIGMAIGSLVMRALQ